MRTRSIILPAVLLLVVVASGAAADVSFQAERELGRDFDLALRREAPMIDDPEVVAYVRRVGEKITASLDGSFFDYQFSVIRDASVNAFAVPGGYVYVHSGLFARVENDDQLAAVLGHEAAHVHAHHIARQQEATQLMNYAALLGSFLSIVQPAVGPLVTGASAAVSLHYRREFEQEADYLGVRYLRSSGHDPRAMLDFFKKLADEQRSLPTFAPPYLQSHPVTDDRLNHLEAVLRTQQWAPRERASTTFALRQVQVLAQARTDPPLEVQELYRERAAQNPEDPVARYLFGLACLETNRLDLAEKALAVAWDGKVAAAQRDLGRLALRKRDPARARDLLLAYLETDPADARAHADLAKVLQLTGDNPGAVASYRRVLEVEPTLQSAHRELGLLEGRTGDEAAGFFHLATAARLGGDYEKAMAQYARAVPLLPKGDPRGVEAQRWLDELGRFLGVGKPAAGAPVEDGKKGG